jgi:hypothetical protein
VTLMGTKPIDCGVIGVPIVNHPATIELLIF